MTLKLWQWAAAAGAVTVLAATIAAGCSATNTDFPEDETDPATSGGGMVGMGGQTATSTTTTGGMGGGTESGGGGMGGSRDFPCGIDCASIEAPDCFMAVCNMGAYPGPVGACVVVEEEAGTSCDDGLFCTTLDTCVAGVCTGGPTNTCGLVPPQCTEVTCDEQAMSCSTQAADDGADCEDPNPCILGSFCNAGSCIGGTVNDCFFAQVPNECHIAVCNPTSGICEPEPGNDMDPCVDQNDLCSINNTCAGGVCSGGTAMDCSQLTMNCDLGVCDQMTGQCTTMSVMNGQMCDDLDDCTLGEICTAGLCSGGTLVTNCSLTGDGCCPMNCTAVNDLDCQCMTASITTTFVGGNGSSGNMFDIVALKNIEVQGVEVNINGSTNIEVYYRPGSFVGFDTNMAGWTLAGSAAVSGTSGTPTPVPLTLMINIPSGQTYGFYVTTVSGSMTYTNGAAVGNIAAANADLQVLEGVGKSYPFGSSFTTRVWNGVVNYEQCGN